MYLERIDPVLVYRLCMCVIFFSIILFISSRLWSLRVASACVYVHGCVDACVRAWVRTYVEVGVAHVDVEFARA